MNKVVDEVDFNKPIIRNKSLSASNPGNMTTSIEFPGFSSITLDEPLKHGGGGQGPSPLQGVLGSLCGCEAVTFNRTAQEKNFSYNGLKFEADYTIDIRLREVVEETEARCPVFNLIKDAGVEVESVWIRSIQN